MDSYIEYLDGHRRKLTPNEFEVLKLIVKPYNFHTSIIDSSLVNIVCVDYPSI